MLSNSIQIYTHRFKVNKLYYSHIPKEDLCLSIVIPSFKEPDILTTLESLSKCIPPQGSVEVIMVINAPENCPKEFLETNKSTFSQTQTWIKDEKPEFIEILVIREERLPCKHAGAGWARKIGMDESAQRWALISNDGPILCLDSDCTVSEDYLIAAQKIFTDPEVKIAHFQFKHLYHLEQDPILQKGIIQYELHLRCYIQGLKKAGYPFAVHTLGSCMAVRSSAYVRSGGMNRRKAGEDFYFIHKLLPSGGWRDIPSTVYPSCRISDRVPFGTGRAQTEWQKNPHKLLTYHPEIYALLSQFFEKVTALYSSEINLDLFHPVVRDFLIQSDIINRVNQMKVESNNVRIFQKKFWQWMDGFKILKLTHYLRDRGFPNRPVEEVAQLLIHDFSPTPGALLKKFRQLDLEN